MTLFPRASGILLHPTSLPGKYGIGDLGHWAYRFVDWLSEAGQSIWQVLPLGPTSYGDSPYQTLSAFAGNPNLISLDRLQEMGWLTGDDVADVPNFPEDRVDYGWVIDYHNQKLDAAYTRFEQIGSREEKQTFAQWCAENDYWLHDYAVFVALKQAHDLKPWTEWETRYVKREPNALAEAEQLYQKEIAKHKFYQWVFFSQWLALKNYANDRGIRIFGDLPIFVAHDSADVWANQHEYNLDESGKPSFVAGVPPDYFSPTGQRWGNPLYHWDVMRASGYRWWIERFKASLQLVDYIRIDHFRGFEAYWEIPAEEETAIRGQWLKGPGADFFLTIENELGHLPIIAEDLGVITKGVIELRDRFGLPGMKVLQFAWDEPLNPFLPHNHVPNSIVYTGTHDNNTTVGWWLEEADETTRNFTKDYLAKDVIEINWVMIRQAMRSVAHTSIYPFQDILGLHSVARMNTPGVMSGNWQWRFAADAFDTPSKQRLAHMTWLYQRRADQEPPTIPEEPSQA